MKNHYAVENGQVLVQVRGPKREILTTRVDEFFLDKLLSFPNTWFAWWNIKTKSCYAVGDLWRLGPRKGRPNRIYLHRYLYDVPSGLVVDHINHDTLDNRQQNIRIVTAGQNNQNSLGPRSDNRRSGIRNVYWSKGAQKWMVQLTADGKYHYIGLYSDIKQAEQAAKEARAKYMPFSQEAYIKGGGQIYVN